MDFLRENKALRFILALAVFALCLWLVVSGQQLTGTPGGLLRMLAGLAYGRGLFVLDSVTRGNSQLETSMVRQGIVTASRHVFLDDPQGTDKVLAALDKAARLARKQGIAIAIGHPHASTLRALERWENREGVAVVPLRRYVWHLAQLRAGQFGKPE